MPLFVSMHFRFELDINMNFTMQNRECVFISEFFLLLTHLTPKHFSPFIYYKTLSDYVTHFLNDK